MILSGFCRLGRDVEVRYTPSGDAVANLSLAFNYGKKDNEGKRPTTWVDASMWGPRAEKLAEYLKSGQPLDVVLNDVHVVQYKKGDGSAGASLRGNVQVIDFAGKNPNEAGTRSDPAKPTPADKQDAARAPKSTGSPGNRFDDFDSDIPF